MRRTILLAVMAIAIALGTTYGLAAASTPASPVTIRSGELDPTELDRLIASSEVALRAEPVHLQYFDLGRLYLTRAHLWSAVTDYERAVDLLTHAHDIDPDPATSIELGNALVAVHDFAGALEAVAPIRRSSPESNAAAGVEFDALIGLGRDVRAATALDELLAAHPEEPAILVRAALLAWQGGNAGQAVESSELAARRAVDAGLSNRERSFYLSVAGRYAFAAGDIRSALDLLTQAVDIYPDAAGGWLALARAHAAAGYLDSALAAGERAAGLVPDPEALGLLADLHLATGDEARAAEQLRIVDAIADLGHEAYRRQILTVWLDHGRHPEEALALAREEIAARPDRQAHLLLARALLLNGRIDEATRQAELSIGPADASMWYHAGVVAQAAGDDVVAVERFEVASDLNPSFHPRFGIDLVIRLEGNRP